MAKTQRDVTFYDLLYGYHTRLQGVANDLAVRLARIIGDTDDKVVEILKTAPASSNRPLEKELERLTKIISRIESTRAPAYNAALDLILDTSARVAKAGTTQTEREFNAQLRAQRQKAREARFVKTLNRKQLQAIIDGQGISGETIREWFHRWKTKDIQELARLARRASVESLTVAEITRLARGVINGNAEYSGVLKNTKVDAARMARTIVNGVSNNARAETIRQNADVIDGIRFVGTLDGKTCPYCASYDGYIWRGDDMATARRPPIHPNCRCTLAPVVELKDAQGNPVPLVDENGKPLEGVDENGNPYGLRPAANADFDKLARDAYNAQAREKGWERRFDDLAVSTRLKYYYQAQKDYEKRTGKPAYRQVPSAMTFKQYFEKQPEAFQKAWLGERAFKQYKSGVITNEKDREKILLTPYLGYQVDARALGEWQDRFDASRNEGDDLEKLAAMEPPAQDESTTETEQTETKNGDPVYVEESIVFTVNTGNKEYSFAYGDENKLEEILKDVTPKELSTIQDELNKYKDEDDDPFAAMLVEATGGTKYSLKKIDEKRPKRDDYQSEKNYNDAVGKWEAEKARAQQFFTAFDAELNRIETGRIQRESDGLETYGRPITLEIPEYGSWEENTVPRWLDNVKTQSLENLRNVAYSTIDSLIDETRQRKPKRDEFYYGGNYTRAVINWEKTLARIDNIRDYIRLEIDYRQQKESEDGRGDVARESLRIINERREREDGKEKADAKRAQAALYAEVMNTAKRLEIEKKLCKKAVDDGEEIRRRVRWGIRRDPGKDYWARLERQEARLQELETELLKIQKQQLQLRWYENRSGLREEADGIIQALFPDSGGTVLLTNQTKDHFVEVFRDQDHEPEAKSAIAFYDVIAKHFNTSGRTIDQPTARFSETREKTGGYIDLDHGEIVVSSQHFGDGRGGDDAAAALVHEKGHWLENWGLGCQKSNENVQWLYNKLGIPERSRHLRRSDNIYDDDNAPNLTARDDNYAQRVYFGNSPNDHNRKGFTGNNYELCELMSVGMEYLYKDPETFIRRHPEHFKLVIENLSELRR